MKEWRKISNNTEVKHRRRECKVKESTYLYFRDYNNFTMCKVNILSNEIEYYRFFNGTLYVLSPEEYKHFTDIRLINFATAFKCTNVVTENFNLIEIKNYKRRDSQERFIQTTKEYADKNNIKSKPAIPIYVALLEAVNGIIEQSKPKAVRTLFKQYLDEGCVNMNSEENKDILRYKNFVIKKDFIYVKDNTYTIFKVKKMVSPHTNKIIGKSFVCEDDVLVQTKYVKSELSAIEVNERQEIKKLNIKEDVFKLLLKQ